MKPAQLFAALAMAGIVGSAVAAPINIGGPLTATFVVNFEDVAGGAEPGTNYDGILVSGGVSFAERFAGQTLSQVPSGFSLYDVLSGTPNAGLALAAGAAGENVVVTETTVGPLDPGYYATKAMSGLGGNGYPDGDAQGEGSFAVLFTFDQSEFGFDLIGGDLGTATLDFFRRDGSLIERVTLSALSSQSYTFLRDGGVKDIAGVSVFNDDMGGIGVDNIRYNVNSAAGGGVGGATPEPGTMALVGLALVGLAAARRRSQPR